MRGENILQNGKNMIKYQKSRGRAGKAVRGVCVKGERDGVQNSDMR